MQHTHQLALSTWHAGREKFIVEVFKWVKTYGGKIQGQIRRMGASVDWSREAFTMDEKLSNAVIEAFLRMHASGLIYRHNRLVHWDCTLKTAVSEIEVQALYLLGFFVKGTKRKKYTFALLRRPVIRGSACLSPVKVFQLRDALSAGEAALVC